MGDFAERTHAARGQRDGGLVAVAFDKHRTRDEEDDEDAAETAHLRWSPEDAVEEQQQQQEEEDKDSDSSARRNGTEALCLPACGGKKPASCACTPGSEKPKRCPGLGLFYAFVATVFFSIISLMVKTIDGLNPIMISATRCFFQMLFIAPLLIYHKIGFLGPRDQRVYLVLRGFFGSNAMIMLFYAIHQMPLADATVIMFSNPVFTSLLACIFLKERCTIWDCIFTIFTLTGVILIARPPFLFGERLYGIEGDYSNHIKGTIAAFAGAIGSACTLVVLRKMGKSVHYYLSVWYYAVIGFIECVITVSILGEWAIPFCGRDRWMLMLIAVFGIAGQAFLTKALQIEKAGPVALVRTMDVVLSFIYQFIFFHHAPTWWSLGGALCVVMSTSGVALQKWLKRSYKSSAGQAA